MKSQFIIMALLCIIGFTAYNQNAWIKTSLQDKHTVSCMISIGTDLVVGTTGDGIYKSNDNGESWQKKTDGLIVNRIMAMTISGASIYAVGYGQGILKSTDRGDSWELIKSPPDKYLFSIESSGPNLVVGTWLGIYYSNDENNWDKAIINGPRTHNVTFSLFNSSKGLLAGSGDYIFISKDNGKTWDSKKTVSNFDHQVFFAEKNIIHSGTSGDGILISTDGENWIKKQPILSESEIKNVTAIATDSLGLLVSSTNTNIVNQGEKMVNEKADLRAKSIHYHKGYYFAGAFGGGLWRLEGKKKLSELEVRNSFTLNTSLYPNPLNNQSVLQYTINQDAAVNIDILYANGSLYKKWKHGKQIAGTYQISIQDFNLSSGIYFIRIIADKTSSIKKMVIIQ